MTAGNYDIPVPEHWFPLIQSSEIISLVNTDPTLPPRDGRYHTTALVTLLPFRRSPVGANQVGFWLSLQRQRLERERVKSVETTLRFDDEAVICVGGTELSGIMRDEKAFPDTSVISLSCLSAHGLEIQFIGEPWDVEPFYKFVSQIHRHG